MSSNSPKARRAPRNSVAFTCVALAAALLWTAAEQAKAHALSRRLSWQATEDLVVLPPPEAAPFLAAGYRELVADITWSRALVYYGSTRIGKSDLRYLKPFVDTIITLDPHFKRVYKWASFAVTFKNETATHEEFLDSIHYAERGMEVFPDDYEFFWLAGLRYSLDLRTDDEALMRSYRERGAELIEQAMRKPNAPPNLATLAAELRTRLGQRERALRNLREMILTTDNAAAREQMLAKLGGLTQDLDLAAELEAARESFEARWKATLPFVPPSLYVIVGEPPSLVIDFDRLASDRDLFGTHELSLDRAEPDEEAAADGSTELPSED